MPKPLPLARDALAAALAHRTRPGVLVERASSARADGAGALRCTACAHRCVMERGRTGACGVRTTVDGVLHVPYGYVARRYVRPVETNTVYHVLPGARSLTFGMYGCDLRCPYCHNWKVSQALRDPEAGERAPTDLTPEALVDEAVARGCEVVCAAYNEPLIAAEWAHDVFTEARRRGLVTGVVTDGHSTPETLAFMRPVTDFFRVDLKGWLPEHYKQLGGRLEPVLASIVDARRLGFWVEIVTLVVPGFNDDPRGLAELATRLAAIDPTIPWHLDAFVPRYKLSELASTSPTLLAMAAGAAYARGLQYVYVGNVGDAFPELSSTRCPSCSTTLIGRRDWSTVESYVQDGRCASCGHAVPGIHGRVRA
jgi:pyruvate formate lyase activating enzyme